jgi:hypothetical protein
MPSPMSSQTVNPEDRPTRLVGQKGNYTFEGWIEIDGENAKLYNDAVTEEGDSEAWIASIENTVSY